MAWQRPLRPPCRGPFYYLRPAKRKWVRNVWPFLCRSEDFEWIFSVLKSEQLLSMKHFLRLKFYRSRLKLSSFHVKILNYFKIVLSLRRPAVFTGLSYETSFTAKMCFSLFVTTLRYDKRLVMFSACSNISQYPFMIICSRRSPVFFWWVQRIDADTSNQLNVERSMRV